MKKRLRKGFTLVELVVVIAVVAILATVSVGAYFGITETANRSADEQMVVQMNKMLEIYEIITGKVKNVNNARQIIESNGMKDYLPRSEDNVFYWTENDSRVIIYNKKENVVYPNWAETRYAGVVDPKSNWYNLNDTLTILGKIRTGDKVNFAERTWTVIENEPETLFVTTTNIPSGGVAYDDTYDTSLQDTATNEWYYDNLEDYKSKIALSTIGDLKTTNDVYDENGTDTLKRYVFNISASEVLKLPEEDRKGELQDSDYEEEIWTHPRDCAEGKKYITRTMTSRYESGFSPYKRYCLVDEEGNVSETDNTASGNIFGYRPCLRITKSMISSVTRYQWENSEDEDAVKLYSIDGSKGNVTPLYAGEGDVNVNIVCNSPVFTTAFPDLDLSNLPVYKAKQMYESIYSSIFDYIGFGGYVVTCFDDSIFDWFEISPLEVDMEHDSLAILNMGDGIYLTFKLSLKFNGEYVDPFEYVTTAINGNTYELFVEQLDNSRDGI